MVFKMKNHISNNIFFLFVICGVTAGDTGSVSFSHTRFTVQCYDSAEVYYEGAKSNISQTWEEYGASEKPKDTFSCKTMDGDKKLTTVKFYIKAKVCDNCYDLDGSIVAAVICADLLITGGMILLVYAYGQRKSGPAPPKPTNARNPAGSGGPPVPNPDYQPLSDFTRNKDTYATVHKTG